MPQYLRAPARLKVKQLALCVAFAIPVIVQAQQATPTVTLPEVKVQANALGETTEGTGSYTTGKAKTATPLSMSLRDTPQSISVVTQQRIEDQGLLSINDVINNVTGVSSKALDTSRSGFAARGFDIDNVMTDGVPMVWQAGWSAGETMSDLAIYDRVEVVRGATGLMTGAGNPSAAINLVRKRADSKVLTGSVVLGVGSWDQRRVMADVSSPVNAAGTLRARVVGSYLEQDSWVNLLHDKKQTLFGTIEADLTDSTLLTLGVSRQDNSPTGSMWGGLPSWYSDGSRTNWDRSKTNAANWSTWSSVNTSYFGKLEHRFDNGWKAQVNLSRAENEGALRLLWLTGTPDRVTGLGMTNSASWYDTDRTQDDLSLHASGPVDLFGRKHELAFGYMSSKQELKTYRRAASGLSPMSNFNTWDGSIGEPSWGALTPYEGNTTKQQALYAVARFSITDPLKLIAGARISDWKRDGVTWNGTPYSRTHNGEITPYAGLIYDINANYSFYASYTDIFQPQDYRDRNGNYLDPVAGKSTEAGIKAEFLDGRLNASAAIFQIKQDNSAQPDVGATVPGTTPPAQAYRAAQGVQSDGYELEVAGAITRGWNVSAGWTQFDARDEKGVPANTRFPTKMLKVFTSYRLPGDLNKLVVGGGVNWEGANYLVATNPVTARSEKLEQSSYTLVNLMARYEFSKQLSAQLNINNVFDKTYYSQIGFYSQYAYGAPRNTNLTLKYQF